MNSSVMILSFRCIDIDFSFGRYATKLSKKFRWITKVSCVLRTFVYRLGFSILQKSRVEQKWGKILLRSISLYLYKRKCCSFIILNHFYYYKLQFYWAFCIFQYFSLKQRKIYGNIKFYNFRQWNKKYKQFCSVVIVFLVSIFTVPFDR